MRRGHMRPHGHGPSGLLQGGIFGFRDIYRHRDLYLRRYKHGQHDWIHIDIGRYKHGHHDWLHIGRYKHGHHDWLHIG